MVCATGTASATPSWWRGIIEMEGVDLRPIPLTRRQVLERVLAEQPDGIVQSEVFDHGELLFRHACAMGLEGIVSKRRDSPYRSGRALTWRKVKCEGYTRVTGSG